MHILLCSLLTIAAPSFISQEVVSVEQYDAEIDRLKKIKKQLKKDISAHRDRADQWQFSREMGAESKKAYESIGQLEDRILWIEWQIKKLQEQKQGSSSRPHFS